MTCCESFWECLSNQALRLPSSFSLMYPLRCRCLVDSKKSRAVECLVMGSRGYLQTNLACLPDGSYSGSFEPVHQGFVRLEFFVDGDSAGQSPYSIQVKLVHVCALYGSFRATQCQIVLTHLPVGLATQASVHISMAPYEGASLSMQYDSQACCSMVTPCDECQTGTLHLAPPVAEEQ